MEQFFRLFLSVAFSFLILALFAMLFLKPGSPSFIVNLVGIAMLVLFIILLSVFMRRTLSRSEEKI
ncbi:MAG TPA: hypothetical protein EYH02_01395 [Ignisphaera aggregans]|uniref:Uncharacterized protein n=1 Tax=Ignisphaera aggregans TaxID=334771 RepID=A0A832YYZ3_9CREN|nr:hypothetical protein [Ignisphaera aggregans]